MASGETGAIAGARHPALIVRLANTLSAQGLQPLFLCSPERVHLYTRLGFENWESMPGTKPQSTRRESF